MVRWRAVVLGCVAALGMRAAVGAGVDLTRLPLGPASPFVVMFVALALGGFVAGHFGPDAPVLQGALAASLFILVSATAVAAQEAILASRAGVLRLPPIDLPRLVADDVAALVGASFGAWLARPSRSGPEPPGMR